MADDKKPEAPAPSAFSHPDPFVEIVWLILSIFVILYLINGFVGLLNRGTFSLFGFGITDTGKSIPLSQVPESSYSKVIGGKVVTSQDKTIIYDSPDGWQVGTVAKGTPGKIIEGPVMKYGIKYWHIKFDNGKEGWVAEDNLDYVEGSDLVTKVTDLFAGIFSIFKWFSIIISALLAWFVVHLYKKIVALRTEEAKKMYVGKTESLSVNNKQWERVLNHIESTNESDWRLAILEADILLDTLLDNMGLPGDTMADKLKAVEKSDFTTIDNAWEAHKIRNQIAHEGGTFVLNQPEVRRVVALYQTVFEEFRII